MKFLRTILALGAFAPGVAALAQSATSTDSSMSNSSMEPMPATRIEADVEAVYGFRFDQTGVNVDVGAHVAPGQFVGIEATYFRLTDSSNDAISGTINSREKIGILGLTYRYSMPISRFSDSLGTIPLRLYIGAGAGISDVKLDTSVPKLGYYTSDKDNGGFGADGSVGLEWWATRNFGIKAGFRYIYLYHVELYGQKGNIDTGALEGGLTFRY